MDHFLKTFQSAVAARLQGDETLSALEIIPEDRMDLETEIQTALAKLGACLVVGTTEVGVSNPNLPGPQFDAIRFSVAVVENVMLNRAPGGAQRDALSIAIAVCRRLHHWRPADTEFAGYTVLADEKAIVYQQSAEVLAYDVNFFLGGK